MKVFEGAPWCIAIWPYLSQIELAIFNGRMAHFPKALVSLRIIINHMKSAWTQPWLLEAYPCRRTASAARMSPHHHMPFVPSPAETARLASELIKSRNDSHEMSSGPWESHLNIYMRAFRVFYWIILHTCFIHMGPHWFSAMLELSCTSCWICTFFDLYNHIIFFCVKLACLAMHITQELLIQNPNKAPMLKGWHWMALVAGSVTTGQSHIDWSS